MTLHSALGTARLAERIRQCPSELIDDRDAHRDLLEAVMDLADRASRQTESRATYDALREIIADAAIMRLRIDGPLRRDSSSDQRTYTALLTLAQDAADACFGATPSRKEYSVMRKVSSDLLDILNRESRPWVPWGPRMTVDEAVRIIDGEGAGE